MLAYTSAGTSVGVPCRCSQYGQTDEGGVAARPRPLRLFARTASIDRAHQPTCPPTYTRALSIPQDWPNRRPPHPEQPFSPLFGEVVCMLGAVPFRLPARRGNCTTRGCNTPATHRQRASCRAKPPHQPRHRAARLATVRLRHQTNSDQPRPRSPANDHASRTDL